MEKVTASEPPGEDLQHLFDTMRHMTEQLESGELTLEDSLDVYEQAVQIHRRIRSVLDDADRRVTELIKPDGTTEPFDVAIKAHYSGSRGTPYGKKVCAEIFEDNIHRGWIGFGEPTYKLSPRRRLGLEDARPLQFTVNCFIYRLDADGVVPASKILREWHYVGTRWWEIAYHWTPIHFETMVDPTRILESENPGACFKRAGYRPLGYTTGRSARRPEGHGKGSPRLWVDDTPKLVLYRGPLHRLHVKC
jgi:exodeoxyribonuclease VII small subunit